MTFQDKERHTYDWSLKMLTVESWAYQHKIFDNQEIDQIHQIAKKYKLKEGKVGGDSLKVDTDTSIRDSNVAFFQSNDEDHRWLYEKITRTVLDINQQFWNFDLDKIEILQYTEYKSNQYYKEHTDMMYRGPNHAVRKLSFSVQLTDPDEYKGGDIIIKTDHKGSIVHKNKGTIIFFPSYVLHEVTPVTEGTRHSLVGWVTGPAFK